MGFVQEPVRVSSAGCPPLVCYRKGEGGDDPGTGDNPHEHEDFRLGVGEGRVLVCRRCRSPIARREDAIPVAGQHTHTFFNPAGILFEIGCFQSAPGGVDAGRPSDEFSWFPGHSWRFTSCGVCGRHLGWRFSDSSGGGFWGLILDRLEEGEKD